MKSKYKLLEGTAKIEFVTSEEEFAEAYVRINYMQSYNHQTLEEYDTYYALSAPSPKMGFKGEHNTLILEKSNDAAWDTNCLLDGAIRTAIKCGFEIGKHKILEKIEMEVEYEEN